MQGTEPDICGRPRAVPSPVILTSTPTATGARRNGVPGRVHVIFVEAEVLNYSERTTSTPFAINLVSAGGSRDRDGLFAPVNTGATTTPFCHAMVNVMTVTPPRDTMTMVRTERSAVECLRSRQRQIVRSRVSS